MHAHTRRPVIVFFFALLVAMFATAPARAGAPTDAPLRACGLSLMRDLRAGTTRGRDSYRQRTRVVMRAISRSASCRRISYELRQLAAVMARAHSDDERERVALGLLDGVNPACRAVRAHWSTRPNARANDVMPPQLECVPRDPRIRDMALWGEYDGARFEPRLIAVRFIDAIAQDEPLVPIAQMLWAVLSYDGNDPMLAVQLTFHDLRRGRWPSSPYPLDVLRLSALRYPNGR